MRNTIDSYKLEDTDHIGFCPYLELFFNFKSWNLKIKDFKSLNMKIKVSSERFFLFSTQ